MADTGKRLEVRYGGFACRIEGYDDPVEKMRGVLAAMQQAIAESPALIDEASRLGDGQFDRIRAALADEGAELDAAVPGLVVIRDAEHESQHKALDEAQEAGRAWAPAGGTADEGDDDVVPGESGPHPSAATFAAPAAAAAAAEAAFAAEIAAEDEGPDEGLDEDPDRAPHEAREEARDEARYKARYEARYEAASEPSQGPLGGEEPGRHAVSAATFAAPAAELAATANGSGTPGPARLADQDEEAGDARTLSPDEAQARPMASLGQPEDVPDARDWPAGEADEPDQEAGFVNIFAPPPMPAAEPPASLRREPGRAAADPAVPDWQERVPGEWRDEHALAEHDAGQPEPLPYDEQDPEDEFDAAAEDAAGAGSVSTAENRFAALITRYQNARQRTGEAAPARAGLETEISAAELAERAEAADVTDLLAASAAWLTLAAGRPRFTRREVMEVFDTLPGDHPRTLEARIKGFGKLVRSGALVLVGEGTFAMSQPVRDDFRALLDQR